MINNKLYRNGLKRLNGANGRYEVFGRHGASGLRGLHRACLSFIIYHLLFIISLACPFSAQAQIKVGGNVYGAGNKGDVKGCTRVNVYSGDIGAVTDPDASRPLSNPMGKVFGGARMANVGGNTFVNIDGENASGYVLINYVYGGNDIAGTIGTAKAVSEDVPTELTAVKSAMPEPLPARKTEKHYNDVDDTFNSYVRISTKTLDPADDDSYYTADEVSAAANDSEDPAWNKTPGKDLKPDPDAHKIYIGQLFGGGNGDFDYDQVEDYPEVGKTTHYIYNRSDTEHKSPLATLVTNNGEVGFQEPHLDKTYLEVVGGSIVYGYGGGNNATVKEEAIIHVDNPSNVTNHIFINKNTWLEDPSATAESGDIIDLLSLVRFKEMGINTGFSKPSSGEYQIGRFFGGNNVAAMDIRPKWNLVSGKIRNLYSGGNRGNMTSPEGLLLEIPTYSTLIADYVYGGCRMADVVPTVDGVYVPCTNLQEKDGEGNLIYKFPNELAARTLVRGGNINTVYGGNDVTGKVYGGNAVGIYTTIRGDVYGGGNGAYPYTDNDKFLSDDVYGDFYYAKGDFSSYVEALNAHRPNAEQVSIRLKGNAANDPTVIRGSVFLGGNCATLKSIKSKPLVELKMGSHVIADNVFLGNNGADMTYEDYLKLYANVTADEYSRVDLTDDDTFASYMNGAAMELQPAIVFDSQANGDHDTYIPNSSYVGSFYCGGNVGSMIIPGKNTYKIDQKLNIYTKFVGGCNKAYVDAIDGLCAAYDGGVLGSEAEQAENGYTEGGKMKDRLDIKLENLTITPLRWNDTNQYLVWNTYRWSGHFDAVEAGKTLKEGEIYYTSSTGDGMFEADGTEVSTGSNYYTWEMSEDDESDFEPVPSTPAHAANRLLGGNVYGGCYESGHVNGNIIIDINEDVLQRDEIFGTGYSEVFDRNKSGVELLNQRDDLMSVALIVFGGGYGMDSEVWGSTTVNHNKGYVFQICGGGEMGVVGKHIGTTEAEYGTYTRDDSGNINSFASNGRLYKYDAAYSSTVNLKGSVTATSDEGSVTGLAETEYIYAGGKEGLVCGNTTVNLGNGRLYDAFAGACEADVLGHTEAYIGRQPDGSGGYQDAFPWIQDIVYGGNDFTGTIYGQANFKDKVRVETGEGAFDVLGKVHNPGSKSNPDVLFANAYVEYLRGRVDTIYGGNYGFYDYTQPILTDENGDPYPQPEVKSTFVNIRPDHIPNSNNAITAIFGGGTGYFGNREGDRKQDRSYVLIDIPDNLDNFRTTEIFGAGSFNGLGMNSSYEDIKDPEYNADEKSAIIDLMRGKVGAAYGGSFMEGITRRTMVNVPSGSTINIGSIFGGAYGQDLLSPCDVYEAHVNYSSPDALLVYDPDNDLMKGAIYGGNNACRRTLYGFIDINSNVREQHPVYGTTRATVYGAGCGPMTWSEYTEVNLNDGAEVYEVYGGAQNGEVLNAESAKTFMNKYLFPLDLPEYLQAIYDERGYDDETWSEKLWPYCWTIGEGYYYPYTESGTFDIDTKFDEYPDNEATNLTNVLARTEGMDDRDYSDSRNKARDRYKYNTNVRIHEGAYVANYAYGGGLGSSSMPGSGDVYGTTYIALLGGEVKKDIYAAGTIGVVYDNYESHKFIASSNAYIKGGTCRNVYGGGWEGSVGKHTGGLNAPYYDFVNNKQLDIPGETHVVIGDVGDAKTFADGKPAIQRNAYGGGEGGSVFGTTNLTINNGMIGYRYKNTGTEESPTYEYVAELDEKSPGDNVLDGSGNAFGGGYILNSYVDNTHVKMFGGQIRGSLYGGGEVGPVGRGTIRYKDTYSTSGIVNGKARIFKAGKTKVEMFNGHVLRNVFGGGRGVDSWGGDGTYSMDEAVLATLDKDIKGFIFGQTEVDIYGGEVGTNEGMAYNFGNVFGGCDEGTVYSAYEKNHKLCIGKKDGTRYDGLYEGYYFEYEDDDYREEGEGTAKHRFYTEDCKVLVEPWLQVTTSPITYKGTTYAVGDYIPTAYLNTLKAKTSGGWPAGWDNVDVGKNVIIDEKTVFQERGIIIHNAVFAGGNIALGSSSVSANEVTVYGNATASIHDVYNRDLITIGTGHTGGLYGDGNLTLVDGYRELNITNYGTDKYHLSNELAKNLYDQLPAREQAYYEVKYKCIAENGCTDLERTTYKLGSIVPRDEIIALFTYDNGTSVEIKADGTIADKEKGESGTPALITNSAGQLVVPNPAMWEENGVVSTYAGRIMNTIQRADFCGVFGSRMVMKGAQDRVPDKEDSKLYTINRVREVSLNKMDTPAGDTDEYNVLHGNYFGIYSNVNFLGSLTSDVDFYSTRTTNADLVKNPQLKPNSPTETFAEWKALHIKDRTRNNGNCHNQLALASGVYLELTSEKSTGTRVDQKDWGLITGVVELDLINVSTGVGGGYVYAKNQHGERKDGHQNTTLTKLNETAVSKWRWDYKTADEDREEWETSGNFIHSSQTIIDDCYNISNRYLTANGVPAHYWYIAGSVYVYDQYITAHTGSPNAYSKTVELPITINAASNGKMTLMDVQPNLYAYYATYSNASINTPLTGNSKVVINNVEYHLNDPIDYWEWKKLPASEQKLFVEETYVVRSDCKIGNTNYLAGTVLLPSKYNELAENTTVVTKLEKDENGDYVVVKDKDDHDVTLLFTDVFRPSNNLSHTTGYLLTYDVTNPKIWEPWYTELTGDSRSNKITTAVYTALPAASTKDESGHITEKGQDAYTEGPTYTPKETSLYGQRQYEEGDIIPDKIYDTYTGIASNESTRSYIPNYGKSEGSEGYDASKKQAEFEGAYVITKEYTSPSLHYYKGAPISRTTATSLGEGYAAPAYVCTNTIELSATDYIYVNDLMTLAEKNQLMSDYPALADDIDELIVPAYYCISDGLYGGEVFTVGQNYRALGVWSSMSEEDRSHFTFNYDALDLLIDPTYGITHTEGTRLMQKEGTKYQYDIDLTKESFNPATATDAEKEKMIYSLSKPIDYTATYDGTSESDTEPLTYTDANNVEHSVAVNAELNREAYESLPNEQRHYAPIKVDVGATVEESYTVYVVKEGFVHIETPYAVGAALSDEEYTALTTEEKAYITTLTFTKHDLDPVNDNPSANTSYTFYYCRETYKVNEKGMGQDVESIKGEGSGTTYDTNDAVPQGAVIADGNYSTLVNKQKNFTIHGISPMETSTLYVSHESDINDLSKEKIITVIYKYDYEESDESGLHVTPVSERHIVNIHIQFESGLPIVDDIKAPRIVLPGTSITMRVPSVTPGAYEILGGGWELFENEPDAESHTNGTPYKPAADSLYWYQDGFLLAYYAKTYLGKTYSNAVPVSVANYHDLKGIMNDKTKHLHVDYDRNRLKRDSKIYINDYTSSDMNGLDLFKDFYDLSLITGSSSIYEVEDGEITSVGEGGNSNLVGHTLLNTAVRRIDDEDVMVGVKAGTNLQFYLRTDIEHEGSWTPIASGTDPCFNGTFHGDGHTISGLAPALGTTGSLFHKLCGNVYNLGVMGSFTGAGVADEGDGYIESCWVKTTGTPAAGVKAVFGDPSRTGSTGLTQVVNCYYSENNNYAKPLTENEKAHGVPTEMHDATFYNGEVAYDLNSFYLNKRYYDKHPGSERSFKFWPLNADGSRAENPATITYPSVDDIAAYGDVGYVEKRFADGDFVFAAGEIPTEEDERHIEVTIGTPGSGVETKEDHYYPIWPDDYLFFGQRLNYGYAMSPHQDVPTAIVRAGGRLAQNTQANRVYRAPAYYGSKTMSVAHFNPNVYLAQISKDGTKEAHPNMTAIDFAGHNNNNEVTGTYNLGWDDTNWFYLPLLDDDGLLSIVNQDETQNLLVYAPATSGDGYVNAQTHGVLTSYFLDPDYENDYYDNSSGYRLVRESTASIHGHLVQSDLTATNDHLLVDKQDFNCPILYDFDANHLMWYQRKPDDQEYVDLKKGWQGISIPFTAELVTTHQKGEITHFFQGSTTGHEYWLRAYSDIDEGSNDTEALATFNYPDATGTTKTDGNSFLWDYYYKNEAVHNQKDENADTYAEYRHYYENARTYAGYPLLSAATPYIIGFPGETYYEFDLSGTFEAKNTAEMIEKIGKQVITFASNKGARINVSDDEMDGVEKTYVGAKNFTATFKPNYMNKVLENGKYVMNNVGDAFVKLDDETATSWNTTGAKYTFADVTEFNAEVAAGKLYTDEIGMTELTWEAYNANTESRTATYYKRTTVKTTANDTHGVTPSLSAFRPYFLATITNTSTKGKLPSRILFNRTNGSEFEGGPESALDGTVEIFARGRNIVTRSHMKEATTIRIINIGGVTVADFVLPAGQTIETPVQAHGAYIVNKKKVFVR